MLALALIVCWMWARRLPLHTTSSGRISIFAVPVIFFLSAAGARILATIISDSGPDRFRAPRDPCQVPSFRSVAVRRSPGSCLCPAGRYFFQDDLQTCLHYCHRLAARAQGRCFLAGCCWGDVTASPSPSGDGYPSQVQTLGWMTGDWIPALSFPRGATPMSSISRSGLSIRARRRHCPFM